MSLYTTTLDIVQYVEEQSNEITDGTSPFRQTAISLVNRAHKAIFAGGMELNEDGEGPTIFNFAKSTYPQNLMLLPKVEGTVTATLDSTTLTFSAAPSINLLGYHIRINNDAEVYRITAHTGVSTTATIESAYIKTTGAYEYKAFKLIYTLSGIMMLMGEFQTSRRYGLECNEIIVTGKSTLNSKYPLSSVSEMLPTMAAILKLDPDTGEVTLQFNGYPREREKISMDYIPIPTDLDLVGSNPLLPKHHRLVLGELALYYYQLGLDDDRAMMHLSNAKAMYKSLVRENSAFEEVANSNYGRLFPSEENKDQWRDYLVSESGYIYGIW